MPLAVLVIGIALLVSALRGTEKTLGQQLVKDFTGGGSYVDWVAAIIILGLIGYVPNLETPSRALLGLVLLVFIVSNNGVFSNLQQALSQTSVPAIPTSAETQFPLSGPVPVQITGGSSGGLNIPGLSSLLSSSSSTSGGQDFGGGGDIVTGSDPAP